MIKITTQDGQVLSDEDLAVIATEEKKEATRVRLANLVVTT